MSRIVTVPQRHPLARRRPAAVTLLWVWEASLGVSLGSAIASIAGNAYGRHPDGDAPLFAPGGLELLDLVRHSLAARGPILSAVIVLVLVSRLIGIAPAAAAYAQIARRRLDGGPPPMLESLARSAIAFPASLTVGLVTLAVQIGVGAVGVAIAAVASPLFAARLEERRSDVLSAMIVAAAVVICWLVGVVSDLARATIVAREARALPAGYHAVATFARRPLGLVWSAAWRGAAAWLPVVIAGMLASRIGGRGGFALVCLAFVHQLAIGARVAIRASWMARSLRAILA